MQRARVASLQRNAVRARHFLEPRAHRPALAALGLFESAADTANRFEELLIIEQLLVRLCTLNNHLGLSVDCEYGRPARLLQATNVIPGVALELAQEMDITQREHDIQFT